MRIIVKSIHKSQLSQVFTNLSRKFRDGYCVMVADVFSQNISATIDRLGQILI